MRRLTPRQPATLNLDDHEDAIECRVHSVHGPVALLERVSDAPHSLRRQLTSGSLCMMLFTHEGTLIALRGLATATSDELTRFTFVVVDGVQIDERRTTQRIPLVTRARVSTINQDGTTMPSAETFTADISLGGARIRRGPGLGPGPRFRLALSFRGERNPVCCEAQLARETPTHLGLRLTDLTPTDRLRLAHILADHQLQATQHREDEDTR